MEKRDKEILPGIWRERLLAYHDRSAAVCSGLFTLKGEIIYANAGMRSLIGSSDAGAVEYFVNPTFERLTADADKEGLVFEGIMTVRNPARKSVDVSIDATAFLERGQLFIHGEHDIEQYENINHEMNVMNTELNNTRRELIKEKLLLERTLDQLRKTQEELIRSEKMSSLGRMVAGFAHELNTPVGIAITAASALSEARENISLMLEKDEADEEELVENLEQIREASQLVLKNLERSGELVDSFKRTAIAQSADAPRLFRLRECIDDVIVSLRHRLRNTGIEIHIRCPGDLNIYGLPGAAAQLLTNLIMNSLVHGFPDGEAGEIRIEAGMEDMVLSLDYSDNGKGMARETAERAFEPFFTTARNRGGTGLGLYVCFNIVRDQLKGEITCRSAPDEGAVFLIRFPVKGINDETDS